ncbi:Schwann cell myelin protein-like isoform X2 [Bufo bufo]|uniref:Schwann cell myelin protein-like isoform X2 n=1 Tax=Bufo bufo TaxID=8384 RepID=UPI001ABE766A|nr:Schwann cell myelin protein-like isoform X2 [Bufo bufo]
MAGGKPIFLLIVFQGFYLGSVCQEWTFPSIITALNGSCVEIPCTYHPANTSGTSSTVWYLYKYMHRDPEILNTRDSSSVKADYRDRTSLVPGENSCTLRIDPVRGEDDEEYYPGITEDININANKKYSTTVSLYVTDSPRIFGFYVLTFLRERKATIMQCAADHTCGSSPPSLKWNKPGRITKKSVEISAGSWREESELTYIPSYVDDGTRVQCTVIYPNGQKIKRSDKLNIEYAPKNVSVIVMEEVMEGGDVTLQCKSFSKPEVDDYEWYKGKTKLPDRGQKITVRNVTRNMEPYSCAVRNYLGRRKSAPTEIQPVTCIQSATCSIYNQMSTPAEGSHSRKVILPATIGTICSLLLVLLVYFCWRRSQMNQTSHKTTESPDATYTDLLKNDVGQNYEQLKTAESPEATYAVLIKSDVGQDYEQLKPGIIRRGHEGAVHQYENIYK